MKKIIKIACAIDENSNFSKKHFCSAKIFIYSLDLEKSISKSLNKIKNFYFNYFQ